MNKIYKVGIVGYGNLGKGAIAAIAQSPDMELCAVFSRRANISIDAKDVPVVSIDDAAQWIGKLDAVLLCVGSATDLPVQGPYFAQYFNTVDTFDNHAHIPEYFAKMDAAAKQSGHASLISIGWDPGLFSLQRIYGEAVLPKGESYTFWGKGVSQGHSDAVRRIEGVQDAKQYTIPCQEALDAVRKGENPVLTTRQKHTRLCYVVAKDGADKAAIEKQIKEMPNYFADYDTTVNFISEETMAKEHSGMPHGGFVLRSGNTAEGDAHVLEYSLKLESNPGFTSSVATAFTRACIRMASKGMCGAFTAFDVPPAMLSPKSGEELRRTLL
ncbi:MAG: diaminopimelate dehydrogenase [Oscillospiraceae bacterium]